MFQQVLETTAMVWLLLLFFIILGVAYLWYLYQRKADSNQQRTPSQNQENLPRRVRKERPRPSKKGDLDEPAIRSHGSERKAGSKKDSKEEEKSHWPARNTQGSFKRKNRFNEERRFGQAQSHGKTRNDRGNREAPRFSPPGPKKKNKPLSHSSEDVKQKRNEGSRQKEKKRDFKISENTWPTLLTVVLVMVMVIVIVVVSLKVLS